MDRLLRHLQVGKLDFVPSAWQFWFYKKSCFLVIQIEKLKTGMSQTRLQKVLFLLGRINEIKKFRNS